MNELYFHLEYMQLQEQVLTRLSKQEPLDELLPWAFPMVGTEEGDLEDVYAKCWIFGYGFISTDIRS